MGTPELREHLINRGVFSTQQKLQLADSVVSVRTI
jgi:hypothetical protein